MIKFTALCIRNTLMLSINLDVLVDTIEAVAAVN